MVWCFVCSLLLLAVFEEGLGESCVAGSLPPLANSIWLSHEQRWFIDHKNFNLCSGRLKNYEVEHYSISGSDQQHELYLSIWKPVGNNSYEMVNESKTYVAHTESNKKRRRKRETLTVDLDEKFVYVPEGSVVGAYIPNDGIPVVGYKLGSSEYGLCVSAQGDGNETNLTCDINDWRRLHVVSNIEIIDCGSLNNIDFGSVELLNDESTEYRSVAEYQCNQTAGYILVGNKNRFCTENGTWNGTEPSCQLFNCSDPGYIQNGQQNGDSFTFGSTILYSCNDGYYLTGDSYITCGINMTWNSTETAVCNPVTCDDPGNLVNGERIGSEFKYQSVVSFFCDVGYYLEGSNAIMCQADKTWNSSLPLCEPISCGNPGTPQNGFQLKNTSYTYNSSVEFACDTGYSLSTYQSAIFCLANGSWSGIIPECLPVSCEPPPLPNNGSIVNFNSKSVYTYMTSVVYQCNDGHFLNGSNVTTCTASKEWSTAPPECLKLCPDFDFPNGVLHPNNGPFISGYILWLSCTSGYDLFGENVIECSPTGAWNSSIPECKAISKTDQVSMTSSSYYDSTQDSTLTITIDSTMSHSLFQLTSSSTDPSPHTHATTSTSRTIVDHLPSTSVATSSHTPSISNTGNIFISTATSSIATDILTETDSSRMTVVYIVVTAVAVTLLIATTIVIIVVVLCLVKRKSGSKKYIVNANPTNPMANTGVHCSGNVVSAGVNFKNAEQEVHLPEAAYEEPVKTLKMTPESDYSHLNTVVVDVAEPCEASVFINSQQDKVIYRPSQETTFEFNSDPDKCGSQEHSLTMLNSEGHTNQMYMDIDESMKTLPMKVEQQRNGNKSSAVNSSQTLDHAPVVNEIYFQTMPIKRSHLSIYEVPASQPNELFWQLRKKNVKNISKSLITIGETLGSGFFGRVYSATYMFKGKSTVEVAVKTLREGANEQERIKFLQEAAVMSQFKHVNVLSLHGIIVENDSCMIVTELMEKGDLKQLLSKMRPDPGELSNGDLPHELLNFSRQVCMGLTYLSEKGYVHRDIAARNILVNERKICKIADFGLSRDLEDEDYYLATKGAKIPVKWTAPEALHFRKYSTASDVWSFGCLLYEIWSLGLSPFTGVTNVESIRKVERGYRLPPPPGCSLPIYELMITCWNPDPSLRPSFQDIMLNLLQQDAMILLIPEEELSSDSQVGVLGASLTVAEKMYGKLQQTYLTDIKNL